MNRPGDRMDVTSVSREYIDGRKVIVSVSGGKDSAAASLYLHECGIEHDRVFLDTSWEHQDTYDYIAGPLTKALGPIKVVRGDRGFADLARHKGMFPSRLRRFCTQQLKLYPMRDYIDSLNLDGCINAVGVRARESTARSVLGEWEQAKDHSGRSLPFETWRPILRWTIDDVIDIHRRHDLQPNPLYLRGHSRVGCWPCIFARKSEIKRIAETDPERIDLIRQLEHEVGDVAEARQTAKGTSLEEQGYQRPKFFQAMGALRTEGRDGRCVPIDDVVRWATTGRGGRQFELFAAQEPPGCMRWGLCEGNWSDGDEE